RCIPCPECRQSQQRLRRVRVSEPQRNAGGAMREYRTHRRPGDLPGHPPEVAVADRFAAGHQRTPGGHMTRILATLAMLFAVPVLAAEPVKLFDGNTIVAWQTAPAHTSPLDAQPIVGAT